MEEIRNEEPQVENERRRKRKEEKKAHITIPIPAFLTKIGEDVRWYYDVRLWSPLIVLLLILALLPGKKAEPVETTPEITVVEELPTVATEPVREPIIPEAEALARLADTVGAGRSENVKAVIMWVAINRSEDRANGYGLSLEEEIARPSQWQYYDENAGYNQQTYELAKSVVNTWKQNGLRPLESDMLWLVLNDNGSVTVRNQFTASNNQKWHERTIR